MFAIRRPRANSKYMILRKGRGWWTNASLRERGAVLKGVVLKERRGEKTGKGAAAV